MKKKILLLFMLCLFSLTSLYYATYSVSCMPNLDKYKEYEGNVIQYCEDMTGFLIVSDEGTYIESPMGQKNSQKFKYYVDNNKIKQVYRTDEVFCVVTWAGSEPTCLVYKIK